MHLSYMHPVTSENQFHCTSLYSRIHKDGVPPGRSVLHCTACTRNSTSRVTKQTTSKYSFTDSFTTSTQIFRRKFTNGVYSSLFRAKASGGHSKARETRDAQFLQKITRFALIGRGLARPRRVCKCPPLRIPLSQSPF